MAAQDRIKAVLLRFSLKPSALGGAVDMGNASSQNQETEITQLVSILAALTAGIAPKVAAVAPAVQDVSLSDTLAHQFVAAPCAVGIWVEALSTNTLSVFVGPSGVTTGTGLELQAGDREFFPVDNASRFYGICATATQHIRVLAI